MRLRSMQCLIYLLGLLFCHGIHGKDPEDGLSSNPSPLHVAKSYQFLSEKSSVDRLEKRNKRMLLAITELQSSMTMPQMDVVTPITTVPVINPTTPSNAVPVYNPSPTNAVPVYNPSPTNAVPVYNPFPTPSNPTTPLMTPVTTNPYSTPTTVTPSSSGQSWCVASQTASQTALQVAIDYACGYGGADCSGIQPSGSCYNPNTLRDHASYAFNDYYQKNPIPTSCDFGGTAVITNVDPSTGTCQYPSTSTSSSVLNTTNPTGSTVYGGSVPPTYSGSISMFKSMTLFITVTCLATSPMFLNVPL